jgi:hypothetical protein
MKTMRTALSALIFAFSFVSPGVAAGAPSAHVDATEFLDYLNRNGVRDEGDLQVREAEVNMGLTICNMYATLGSNALVNRTLAQQNNPSLNPAVWTVGSVSYLCPQYRSLLARY